LKAVIYKQKVIQNTFG